MATNLLLRDGPKGHPPPINFHSFGSLFGVAVYAFMCHHSIPGLISPIRGIKNNFNKKLFLIYSLIYLFYCALSLTGSFAFEHTQDIYTINFLHEQTEHFNIWDSLIDYFLALFPVFVLTSSYIIVAITLCNNMRVLFKLINERFGRIFNNLNNTENIGENNNIEDNEPLLGNEYNNNILPEEEQQPINFHSSNILNSSQIINSPIKLFLSKYGITLIILLIPSLISMNTDNVLLLASITGSFPGVGVQYILPALLILSARRALFTKIGSNTIPLNLLSSPFKHWLWPIGILCWAIFAILIVSLNIFHLG
uniref:Aa_trans domain-containing protein n=1 Tax=Meloidogyne hapla TaxID=6305 RepID=A0A1I8B2P7_MELHA